jgi:Uma2 family endonuclease
MSAALKLRPPTTLAEFLDWEQGQELRYEWDGVQPIAMVGGTLGHSIIASRLAGAIEAGLRGRRCTVFRSDARVMTMGGTRIRYPDVVVTCAPFRPTDTAVPEPILIVEVLSESTTGVDLGAKLREYAQLPSLRRYVALSSEAVLAIVFTPANGFRGEDKTATLDLPELDISLPLSPLYEGLL